MRIRHTQAIMTENNNISQIVDLYYEIDKENEKVQLEIVAPGEEESFFNLDISIKEFLENEADFQEDQIIDDVNTVINDNFVVHQLDNQDHILIDAEYQELEQIILDNNFNDYLTLFIVNNLDDIEDEINHATIIQDHSEIETLIMNRLDTDVLIRKKQVRSNRSETCTVTQLDDTEYKFIKTENYCVFIKQY